MLVRAGEQPRTGAAIPSSANPSEAVIFHGDLQFLTRTAGDNLQHKLGY